MERAEELELEQFHSEVRLHQFPSLGIELPYL